MNMRIANLMLAALAFAGLARAELTPLPPQPADVPWPTSEWPTGPLPSQVDADAFKAAMSDAFEGKIPGLGETRAVVVIHDGRLIHEQYANGYSAQTKLISWSMAKSVTQALVGIAVLQQKVDPDKPMGSPHWAAGDQRATIPWRTWLQMTDGQRYLEIEAPSIAESDAARKLFGPGRLDVARYCAGLPLIHQPGKYWNYNSCGIVLTADALTRAVVPAPSSPQARRAAMLQWMRTNLFDVLGMNPQPEFDANGLYYGSALIYASARDFAKLGLLYLRDGMWDGRRVLPEGWVDFARTPGTGANADLYGAGWWVEPRAGEGRPYPWRMDTGPLRDAFSAEGFEGQFTMVVPSKNLIVVRMGLTNEQQLRTGDVRRWMSRVVKTFQPPAPVQASTTQ